MDGEATTARISADAWARSAEMLDRLGHAVIQGLLAPAECRALARLYENEKLFRSRVVMERHAFGAGEYKYFRYPLPPLVAALRRELYRGLAPIANLWAARLGQEQRYPSELDAFVAHCRAAGQGE